MKNLINYLVLLLLVFFTNAHAAKITSDILNIQKPGSASDKIIKLGDNRLIRSNETSGSLEFSNDAGALWKKIGSGSGGGGGENFNNSFQDGQNPNAEDGLTGWTASGGTFALDSSDPLEGVNSFAWTPSATSQTLDSSVLNFDRAVFKGRACQAQVEYVGATADTITLQVIDANNDVLGSQLLPAHSISSPESIFFLCPNQSAITGDANKGNLRLRLINTGGSPSSLITFDKSYVGTLIGLSETVLPDVFSARINSSGVVLSESSNFLDGDCTLVATGKYTCNFLSGSFSEIPSISIIANSPNNTDNPHVISHDSVTATGFNLTIQNNGASSGVNESNAFHVIAQKQGADAKQSVQVYKSIPKSSENINRFSARVDDGSPAPVLSENSDFIDGDCTRNSTGNYTCNFISGIFSQAPSVQATAVTAGNQYAAIELISSSSITIQLRSDSGSAINAAFNLIVEKQSSDFKLPTVQPILVNQVTTRNQQGSEKGACHIINTGAASFDSSDPDCWFVQSLNRLGVGSIDVTLVSSGFKCTGTALQIERIAAFRTTGGGQISTASLPQTFNVITDISSSGANDDISFALNCSKNK